MSLHKEALAEANQLKEIAEKRAKNAIVASITPTIKKLIEHKLLEGDDDDKKKDKDVLVDAARQVDLDALQAMGGSPNIDPQAGEDVAFTLPDDEGKVTLDLDALKSKEGDPVIAKDENGEEVEITAEGLQVLARMIGAESENFGMKILNISERFSQLSKDKKILKENVACAEKLKQLKVEVENLYAKLDKSKMSKQHKSLLENRLESLYVEINKKYLPSEISLIEESLTRIGKKVVGIKRVTKNNRLTKKATRALAKTFNNMMKEVLSLNKVSNNLRTIAETVEAKRVSTNISKLYKEIRRMGRSMLSEQDFTLMIKGLPEDTSLDDLDVEVVGAAGGDENMDDLDVGDMEGDEGDDLDLDADVEGDEDIDMDMDDDDDLEESDLHEMDLEVDVDLPLDDMEDELDLDAIDASIASSDVGGDMGMEGDMDMDMDLGDEGGDMGMEDDMGDMDMGGEEDMDLDEIMSEMEDEEEELSEGGEVLEISENMLRRELKRMAGRRRLNEEVSDAMIDPKASNFGGGHAEKEPFRDMDDSDITTENKELKSKLKKEARMNRALKSQLEQFKRHVTKLKKELAEQALFNEKIVHANKLLQNENLNPKVKLKIINALDGAESLTEVRKTYKTLVKALEKRNSKKNLSEGTRILGSSSRTTKSGGSRNNEVITENVDPALKRWSMLAGLD